MSTICESYFTGDDGDGLLIYGNNWQTQTFTPAFTHTITSIKVLLFRVGNPGTITVSIQGTDVNSHPTGTDLCSGTTDGNTLATASPYTKREISFGAGVLLTAGIKYALVIRAAGVSPANMLRWRVNNSGTYSGGDIEGSSDAGISWTTYSGDCMFECWGTGNTGKLVGCWIAFASDPYDASPIWTHLSGDLRALSIRKGRQHALDRIEAGIAIITLNNAHHYYYPNNQSSPYYPNIKPGKQVNIMVGFDGTPYHIFTGYVTDYIPGWLDKSGISPIMQISAVGLIGNISRLLLNDGAGFSAELSGTRISNVLDKLSPNIGRDLATGQSTMQATGALANINAQDHLNTVQQSELGYIFEAGDGDIQFHDRHTRLTSPYITSQAIFSDVQGQMRYIAIKLSYGDDFIYNDVRIQRSGGSEQAATDTTSKTEYGQRSLSRTGLLMTTDAEALSQANYLLSRYKDPSLRAETITVYPDADPNRLYPKVLGFDIGTRITLQLSQAGIDEDYHIEGISHDWDARDNRWVTKWQLSNADAQKYWILGIAGFSELAETTRLPY